MAHLPNLEKAGLRFAKKIHNHILTIIAFLFFYYLNVYISANNISSLEPISHCTHLQELSLKKNAVSSLSEIDYLAVLFFSFFFF